MDTACKGIRIGDWLRLSAARFADRPCFIDYGEHRTLSFAETNGRVNCLANALSSAGVVKGESLAILAVDSHRYMETLLASMKLGTTYVPLNYRLAEREVQTLVATAGAHWLFVSQRYADLASRIRDQDGRSLRVVCYERDYEDLLAGGDDAEPDVDVNDDDVLGLAFTSGTTGLPKGVMQSQRMMKNLVLNAMTDYAVETHECRYSAAPLFHIAGMAMIFMGVARGFTSVLDQQFNAERVLSLMQQGKLTACFMVPTMINSVINLPGARGATYAGLRTILYGAAPMPPALLREAMDVFGCDFINAFGAGTEAGLQTVLTADDHRRAAAGEEHLLGSIGKAAFGVDLRLCDPDLNDVPRGEVGEIVTRSDTVMSGYLRNPEATADSLKDGWFRAGDLAFMDAEGYVYLAGRRKDMIVRGGENVYPIEIETVLAEHAAILDVAVVGIPEPHWGEVVRACLVARPGHSTPSAKELADHCRTNLARYKVPEQYVWMDELPRNASGKVLKRELRLQSDRPAVRSS
ncbi:MAG: hypothetical protein QOH53_2271 [Ilumatobacteraceae bacterium]